MLDGLTTTCCCLQYALVLLPCIRLKHCTSYYCYIVVEAVRLHVFKVERLEDLILSLVFDSNRLSHIPFARLKDR
jgi:hypothetical protein